MPRLSLGLNQRNFNGSRPTSAAAINMGAMRGKGSTSRMFIYCTQRSANPSGCINQFVNIAPPSLSTCEYTFTGTGALSEATVTAYFSNGGTAKVICIEGYTSIDGSAFINNTQITSVTIGNSVTSIGDSAFERCNKLITITLPTNPLFTSINRALFYLCTSLTSLIIPNSVTNIGREVILGTKITSLIIPNSVTSIDGIAFSETILQTVTIANGQLGKPSPATGVPFFGATVTTVLP